MTMDIQKYRNQLNSSSPKFNMVPFIDILFTILIFLVVTSTFQVADQSAAVTGKPEIDENAGPSEYYLIPVAGLREVIVNGEDMSRFIRNSAIAVHTRVIDEGELIIKPKEGKIIITSPPDLPINKAVKSPE
ncbi:MAG: biopolymer transporter ExbD [Euryarchaeota archaeon]